MRKTLLLLAATVACTFSVQAQKTYTLASPDGRLQTTVAAGDALTYAVTFDGRTILDASPLSLTLNNGTTWGADPRVAHKRRQDDRFAVLPRRLDPRPLQRPDAAHERRLVGGVPGL